MCFLSFFVVKKTFQGFPPLTVFAIQNHYNGRQEEGEVRALEPVSITVYLDMFFLVNVLLDVLLLSLMKHVCRLPGRRRRILAGAAVGAAGACVVLLARLWILAQTGAAGMAAGLLCLAAGYVLVPAGMLAAAFGKMARRTFARRLVVLWLMGAGFGGLLSVADGSAFDGWYLPETSVSHQWRLLPLLLWAAAAYAALRTLWGRLIRWRREQENYCRVTLFYRGRSQTVTALWDTGNHLYEPYGHQPVHVITDEACRRLCRTVSQVAYIPFQAVGTGYGLLPGIRIDRMEVERRGRPALSYERPWLAVTKGELSAGRRYEMLLHGDEL